MSTSNQQHKSGPFTYEYTLDEDKLSQQDKQTIHEFFNRENKSEKKHIFAFGNKNSSKVLKHVLDTSIESVDKEEDKIWLRYHIYVYLLSIIAILVLVISYKLSPLLVLIVNILLVLKSSGWFAAKQFKLRKKLLSAYNKALELCDAYNQDYTKFQEQSDPWMKAGINAYKTLLSTNERRLKKNKDTLNQLDTLIEGLKREGGPKQLIY